MSLDERLKGRDWEGLASSSSELSEEARPSLVLELKVDFHPSLAIPPPTTPFSKTQVQVYHWRD